MNTKHEAHIHQAIQLFSLIIGLCIFFTAWINLGTPLPVKAAHRFFDNLKTGHIEEAYNATSAGFRKKTDVQHFNDFVKHYPLVTTITSVNFDETETETQATLIGTITSRDGTVIPMSIEYVQEDGMWMINGLSMTKK